MVRSLFRSIAKASRKHEITYRYASNLLATAKHQLGPKVLTPQAQQVLAELNRDGVAITTVGELLGNCPLFDELTECVAELKERNADLLAADRQEVNRPAEADVRKPFVRYLLGDRPELELDSVYVRFALQHPILRITNAYFGMVTRLAYFNVWHTYRTDAEPQSSQLWHRDFDDPHYIVKVFVYLSDVDEQSGPLSYAAGSHTKGRLRREPDCVAKTRNARRSNDQQMAEVIPADRWIQALGPKGTIVFADTHGYHKGGWARGNERTVYTCMFTSPTVQLAVGHEQFSRLDQNRLPSDPEAAAVLMPR